MLNILQFIHDDSKQSIYERKNYNFEKLLYEKMCKNVGNVLVCAETLPYKTLAPNSKNDHRKFSPPPSSPSRKS